MRDSHAYLIDSQACFGKNNLLENILHVGGVENEK